MTRIRTLCILSNKNNLFIGIKDIWEFTKNKYKCGKILNLNNIYKCGNILSIYNMESQLDYS